MSRLANSSEPQQDLDILQLLTRAKGSWISVRYLKCEINVSGKSIYFSAMEGGKGKQEKENMLEGSTEMETPRRLPSTYFSTQTIFPRSKKNIVCFRNRSWFPL